MSQIAGVESPRMALDAAQARLAGKLVRDLEALDDLWKNDLERNAEDGRAWDDFSEPF